MSDKAISMCDMPVDMLEKQLIIESIPSIMIIVALFVISFLTFLWWSASKGKISDVYSKTLLIAWFVVFFPLWWKTSPLITTVATSLFNTEYSTLQLFAKNCPRSVK